MQTTIQTICQNGKLLPHRTLRWSCDKNCRTRPILTDGTHCLLRATQAINGIRIFFLFSCGFFLRIEIMRNRIWIELIWIKKMLSSLAVILIVCLVLLNRYDAINHWGITPDGTIQPQVWQNLTCDDKPIDPNSTMWILIDSIF